MSERSEFNLCNFEKDLNTLSWLVRKARTEDRFKAIGFNSKLFVSFCGVLMMTIQWKVIKQQTWSDHRHQQQISCRAGRRLSHWEPPA